MTDYDVQHELENQRFVIYTEVGESELTYRLIGESQIDFNHTFVHPSKRGSKVGVSLVKAGIAWAEEQGYDIQASCWYVARYLNKNSVMS